MVLSFRKFLMGLFTPWTRKNTPDEISADDWLKSHNSYHRRSTESVEHGKPIWDRLIETDEERHTLARTGRSVAESFAFEDAKRKREQDATLAAQQLDETVQDLLKSKSEKVGTAWLKLRIRPQPQKYGVSDFGAEHLVSEWLSYLGQIEVEVTKQSGDGGVDVLTNEYCCQVKNYKIQPVSASEVRDLLGTSVSIGKKAIIFTSSGLTADAANFCERNQIAALKYDVVRASLAPLNKHGDLFLRIGLYEGI